MYFKFNIFNLPVFLKIGIQKFLACVPSYINLFPSKIILVIKKIYLNIIIDIIDIN